MRFAYHEVERKTGATHDAGMDAGASQNRADASSQTDAQLPAAGGNGGRGGVGGSTFSSDAGDASSPTEAGGAGGSSSMSDAGTLDASTDAATANDAGAMDAATSAAGSGGTNSAGSGGAGGDASITALPFDSCTQGTGVLFCNGFEEALPWTPSPWGYDKISTGSTEERSTTPKYAGAASAHFSTTKNARDTASRIAYSSLGGRTSGDIWLRYYYYVPNTVTINPYFSAGVMSELSQPYTGFSLLIYPTTVQVESALLPSNAFFGYTFPRDQWVCLEHHVFVDASLGFFEIYADGTRLIKTGNINSIPPTGWTSAEVGIHYVGNGQPPVDVYVDNVVVSTARYGCD